MAVGGGKPQRTVFDGTQPGEPYEVVMGKGQVIDGWELGVLGSSSYDIDPMKIGGERILTIPSSLAYGADGAGNGIIPPNQDLQFTISIVNAQPSGGVSTSTQFKGIVGLVGFLSVMAIIGLVISQNISTLTNILNNQYS